MLSLAQGTVDHICSEIEASGQAALYSLSPYPDRALLEDFSFFYGMPIPGTGGRAVLGLLLTSDQRLGSSEESYFQILAGIGTLALRKAEVETDSRTRAEELQEVLAICADAGTMPSRDSFLELLASRSARFLGYRACFVGLVEEGICRMRWTWRDQASSPANVELDSAIIRNLLASRESFWCEQPRRERGLDGAMLLGMDVEQLLAVPLVGSNNECLGILGVLDRIDGQPTSPEDVQRAQALAAYAALTLNSVRVLENSEKHRQRAETLVSLSLELGSFVEMDDLAKKLIRRGMELLEARCGFMALVRGSRCQIVVAEGTESEHGDHNLNNRLNYALSGILRQCLTNVTAVSGEKFDAYLASELGWRQVVLAPLTGNGGEMLAILGLVDSRRHSSFDIELVQAIAAHAAAALQNSQLFARITRSSREWAEIFDSISDFMLLHDEHQRILRLNRSLSSKVDREPPQILGLPVRDLFDLGNNTPACPFCLDLIGQEFREEFRDPKTGSIYLVSSSRLRGGMDDAHQVVHVLKDVTASRRAERLYRELFDNIQEGAYFSTPDGRLIEVNEALVRMLGYDSREELLGVEARDLYVDPQHRELLKRALHQFGRLRNHEIALLRRDGSIIYVLENSFAIRDDAGQVVEYRGVLLDITEIKHVQSQLLREHDFNTQILNHTQSLIAVVDTAGLISYANRRCCQVAAGVDGELVGSRLENIIPKSHRTALREALHSVLEGKAVNHLEIPLARGNEAIGSFSVNLSPMRNAVGEVNSLVAVMTDITDIAMLQAKLMHTEKMAAVGQLVSGVAHEVNNPLTAIMGFADLLLENPELTKEVKDDLQVIIQESQRTREIVQNLLSFARQTPPEKQRVQLNQVLRKTVLLRSYDLGSHGIDVVEEFDSGLPEVTGDAHQLQQVFLNILNNACDAVADSNRRGRIVITTKQASSSAEVIFRDNGTGIANVERIFDPFYTTKEVGKGTGLGLSICYGIIREHNGEITCFNNPDSEGATFCIRLPFTQCARKPLAKAAAAR
ncbi:MAG TPA: PAS domain-containing protein [Terriglobales bacterium]|nr:PAS domain-containing protein [Terriglobales bacterium]